MKVKSIDVQTAKTWLENGSAVLIDVREADEFAQEHIPQAYSVPLSQLPQALPRFPQGVKRLYHCQRGLRGERACAVVEGEGWNIEGGIEAWKAAAYPVVSREGAKPASLPLMRQVQIVVGAGVLLSVLAGFAGYPPAFAVAGFFGAGLLFAGISGWCGMAVLLSRMPWNRGGKAATSCQR